jgi:hypothetical protein
VAHLFASAAIAGGRMIGADGAELVLLFGLVAPPHEVRPDTMASAAKQTLSTIPDLTTLLFNMNVSSERKINPPGKWSPRKILKSHKIHIL